MKQSLAWISLVSAMLLCFTGCATTPHPPRVGTTVPSGMSDTQLSKNRYAPRPAVSENRVLNEEGRKELQTTLQQIPAKLKTGMITPVGTKKSTPVIKGSPEKQKVLFNFDKADITEVTNEIFGGFLKVNYVLDPGLQGRISLYLEGEYTKQELLTLITRAYNASNIAVVPREGMYYIQPIQRSARSHLPIADALTLQADEKGVRPVIVIYRPKYLDSAQIINTIKFFLTPGRPIISDPMTNSIIFVEDTDNAKTILEVIRALDMNVLQEIGMEVVQLKAISPEDAVKGVEAIMGKLSVFQHSALKNNVAFLPLEQLGGVLILAQNNDMLRFAKRWLTALDVQGQEAGEQIKIYFMENSLAKDIADILVQVFGIKQKSGSKRLQQEVVQNVGKENKTLQIGQSKTINASLSGDVIIIPDETNNAIVVKANASDQEKIKTTIKALDIVPREVLIEMLLAEVTLTDEISYGVEWYLKNKGMDLAGYKGKYSATLDSGTTFNTDFDLGTATSKGLSLYWGSISGDLAALITLLSSKTDVRVLSTPTLLATDNQEASINVGGSEPIITQQSQNTAGENIVNSIQYVDTGIILNVTPHINSGGLVRLEVEQTIRDAEKNTVSGIDSPRFTERKVKTTLLAKDGQTVVIGGIIQHNQTKNKKGIPILSDIPVISPLFTTTSRKKERTELIIAITPHVRKIKDDAYTREFLRKLRRLQERVRNEVRQSDMF